VKYLRDEQGLSELVFQDPEKQVDQLKLVLIFFTIVIALLTLNSIMFSEIPLNLEFIGGMLVLILLYGFVSSDTTNIVAGMLLWILAILASNQAWQGHGLHGTAMVSFPSLMIFANILSGRLLVYSLAGYMLTVFYFFAYAEHIGFIAQSTLTSEELFAKANILSIIILTSTIGISIATNHIKRLVIKLSESVKKHDEIQSAVTKLILFDKLTNLPNETQCNNNIEKILITPNNKNEIFCLIIIELTNFEWIYSSLGEKTANKIICYLADRLQILKSDRAQLYRSSNRVFMYIVRVNDYEEVSEYCQQIIQAIARPFPVKSFDIEMTSAVGVSTLSIDGDNYETLKQKAHAALILAKKSPPNSFKFFENKMETSINNRVKMVQELKKAIVLREFELFYQPKVAMKDQAIIGAEALIRWNKPGVGILPPLDFISVAEESGLINEIGKWALEQACLDCKAWHKLGLSHLTVAVNLSPVQFQRGNLPSIVFRALHQADLSPIFLELEITESLFIDDSKFIKDQVYQISTKGIDIAIDDFGTGYSNLNYLTKFYASSLKVDMVFVMEMQHSTQGEHLVAAIIKMSEIMKLDNVAEGVEDLATYEKLKEMGCLYGQGYYWSKPLPNKEFIEKVTHWQR
jgi:diguanylate cyclase (GGDEF)-like protein